MRPLGICGNIMLVSALATPVLCLIFLIRWMMKKPKKKVGIAVLVCIGSFVFATLIGTDASQGTNYAAPFAAFVAVETFILVVSIKDLRSRRIENIVSAKMVRRYQTTVTRKRYTGGSFGWHGGYRWHWTYVEEPGPIMVVFDVVYKDGQRRQLHLNERSRKCYRIELICEKSKVN